jgi:hypothetical protein
MSLPVQEIHELELSSRCNLACIYCPHPTMTREKADMTWDTFRLAMEHVRYYVKAGTQTELALTGIGEAILHEHFEDVLFLCRQVIGWDRRLTVSTNGIEVTDSLAASFRRAKAEPYVSLHRPEVASLAVRKFVDAGLRVTTNTAFADNSMDWAGQVKWPVLTERGVHPCRYLRDGWAVIRQNGSIDMCCHDALDLYPIGHVRDRPGTLMRRVLPLCEKCFLVVPKEMREQEVAA